MIKLQILAGPDRLAFANSLFAEIDSVPMPGQISPPYSRGGVQPPSYLGEAFLTSDGAGKERELLLVITDSKRKGRSGTVQEFTAALWAANNGFADLIFDNPLGSWVVFRGELDFITQKGWLDRIES